VALLAVLAPVTPMNKPPGALTPSWWTWRRIPPR